MIPATHVEQVRKMWLLCERVGRTHKVDGKLLLALAWVHSGCDAAGPDGLLPLRPETVARLAREGGLTNPRRVLRLCAARLRRQYLRFMRLEAALAAYVAGAAAVREAGGRVPRDAEVQRVVRDVMAAWTWFIQNLDELLHPTPPRAPRTVTGSTADVRVLAPLATCTAAPGAGGASPPLEVPRWQLIAPPDRWRQPLWIDEDMANRMGEIARNLNLPYVFDEPQRTVYVGCAHAAGSPGARGRLIAPLAGADASCNGACQDAPELDVMTAPGAPVVAVANGILMRLETIGATYRILLLLNAPFMHRGHGYLYAWYGGLSRIRLIFEGGPYGPYFTDVYQGELIGWSGQTRRVPSLQFGLWDHADGGKSVPPLALATHFGWTRGRGDGNGERV